MANLILSSLILVAGLLTSCQTPKVAEYEKISIGQEKHDVLELVGSPNASERNQGQDHWTYWLYEPHRPVKMTKEVHFKEGVVVYKGDPIQPVISAEEQDAINLRQDIELSHRPSSGSRSRTYRPNPHPLSQ